MVAHYTGNFLLPIRLSADPDIKIIQGWSDPRLLLGLVIILILAAFALVSARNPRSRPIAFGIAWFFVALAPTSSLVPLYQLANDHRTFFPYVVLSLAAGWGAALLIVRYEKVLFARAAGRLGLILVAALVLGAHARGVHRRNEVWSSGESLWYDVTVKSPGNGRGLMNYGLSQMSRGNYDVALQYYNRTLEILPNYSFLHTNMAILKDAMGKPEEAEDYFKKALQYGRQNPSSYYFYARWLSGRNRLDEASGLVKSGLELSPRHLQMQTLWRDLERTGQRTLQDLLKQAREHPTPETYLNLSLVYYKSGLYQDTIEACRKSLEIKPDYDLAYNNMCSAYNQMGEWDLAIEACRKALQINPAFQRARANLSWAEKGKTGTL